MVGIECCQAILIELWRFYLLSLEVDDGMEGFVITGTCTT